MNERRLEKLTRDFIGDIQSESMREKDTQEAYYDDLRYVLEQVEVELQATKELMR